MASKELLGIFMNRTLKAENLLRTLQKDLEFLGKVLAYKSEREKEAASQETAALQAQVPRIVIAVLSMWGFLNTGSPTTRQPKTMNIIDIWFINEGGVIEKSIDCGGDQSWDKADSDRRTHGSFDARCASRGGEAKGGKSEG